MPRKELRVLIFSAVLILPFQNCGPVGESNFVEESSSGSTGQSQSDSNPNSVDPTNEPPRVIPPEVLCKNNKAPTLRLKGSSSVSIQNTYHDIDTRRLGLSLEFIADPGGSSESSQGLEILGRLKSGANLIRRQDYDQEVMAEPVTGFEKTAILPIRANNSLTLECQSGQADLEFYARETNCGDLRKESNRVTVKVNIESLCSNAVKLLSDNPSQRGDQVGVSVAQDGQTYVVGSNKDDRAGNNIGALFIYQNLNPKNKLETPTRAATILTPSDRAEGDSDDSRLENAGLLGLAVDGDLIAAGFHLRASSSGRRDGAVYIFRRSGANWTQLQRLTPPASSSGLGALFGYSVSLSGGRLAVGAPGDSARGQGAGAVYLYNLVGGQFLLSQKIAPESVTAHSSFGRAVSLSTSQLAVGAPGDDTGLTQGAGSAFVFNLGDLVAKKLNPDGSLKKGAQFGASLSINGSQVAVGAPGFKNGSSAYQIKGSVSVFNTSNQQLQFWIEEDRSDRSQFGAAVSLSSSHLFVGAPEYSSGNELSKSGGVFSFSKNLSGKKLSKDGSLILARIRGSQDQFGLSLSASGRRVLVGSWLDDLSRSLDSVGADVQDGGSAQIVGAK